MNKLVFIQGDLKSEPFTTSDVVAEYTGNSYRSIQRTIEKHLHRLQTLQGTMCIRNHTTSKRKQGWYLKRFINLMNHKKQHF